ncbi:MAG: hypothetical protein R2781_09610, partial [Flavobacteriaceae bacterium]
CVKGGEVYPEQSRRDPFSRTQNHSEEWFFALREEKFTLSEAEGAPHLKFPMDILLTFGPLYPHKKAPVTTEAFKK